jgi:hypothetical protein
MKLLIKIRRGRVEIVYKRKIRRERIKKIMTMVMVKVKVKIRRDPKVTRKLKSTRKERKMNKKRWKTSCKKV